MSADLPVSIGPLTFLLPADKPADDPEAVGDPYKTLFIARLVRIYAFFSLHRMLNWISTKMPPRATSAGSLRVTAALNG